MEENKNIGITAAEELSDDDLEKASGGCLFSHTMEFQYQFELDHDMGKKYRRMRCKDCGYEAFYKYYPAEDAWHVCGPDEYIWAKNNGNITGQTRFI